MAWRLGGAKPLSEPMLEYCQLDPEEQTSVKFYIEIHNFIKKDPFQVVVWKKAVILSLRLNVLKNTKHLPRHQWAKDIQHGKANNKSIRLTIAQSREGASFYPWDQAT